VISVAWLFDFNVWLVAVGLALFFYQGLIIFSAERGRQKDLIKKLHPVPTDFNVGVLIPYADSTDIADLLNLLKAIEQQQYPSSRVRIHVGCTEDTAHDLLDLGATELPQNLKVWTAPENCRHSGQIQAWLVERCLAAGGLGMAIFLKPTDLIRPDYFQNVVQAGLSHHVIQGYVASRFAPHTPLEQVVHLGQRLFNRIHNAGRYHMGLSCQLASTGWAAKQDILEMIPFHQGHTADNLEYTLRLNLADIAVKWAPNMVVFSNEKPRLMNTIHTHLGQMADHGRLLCRYGIALTVQGLFRGHPQLLDAFIQVAQPSAFILGLTLLILGYFAEHPFPGTTLATQGSSAAWYSVAAMVFLSNLMDMLVARVKLGDLVTNSFWTPLVFAAGTILFPVALIRTTAVIAVEIIAGRSRRGYRHQQHTRFNEGMRAEPTLFQDGYHKPDKAVRDLLLRNTASASLQVAQANALSEHRTDYFAEGQPNSTITAPLGNVSPYSSRESSATTPSPLSYDMTPQAALPAVPATVPRHRPLPQVVEKTIPISNGQRYVNALIKIVTDTDEDGRQNHQMSLNYKNVSFQSQSYQILDQAFYELESKLLSRGMTIVSCGSCGYFYNPTADIPSSQKNAGVCLFGKRGRDVSLITDCVGVTSQACTYHAPLDQRETIVRQWRESLISPSTAP